MLSQDRLQELLRPYASELDARALDQISTYLQLLMRWNEKINLTAIRTPEEAVTRHFGESFLVAQAGPLDGRLLDIGSGAGFPGLALKIMFATVEVTLLEPVAKRRAFLKEVARVCDFAGVTVRGERLEEFAGKGERFEAVTARAVGDLENLVATSIPLLSGSGMLYLWLSHPQSEHLRAQAAGIRWVQELELPRSRERVILIGTRPQ